MLEVNLHLARRANQMGPANKALEVIARLTGNLDGPVATPSQAPGEIYWENVPLDLAERFIATHDELVALHTG